MKFKSRQLFLSALMALLLSTGNTYGQEIITGNRSISDDSGSITTNKYVQIGSATTVGAISMTGGAISTTGVDEAAIPLMPRTDFKPGLDIINGSLSISSGTITTSEGIFVRGTNGNNAVINISGGTLTSNTYPAIGAEKGTSGTMNISGGEFISNKSFYCGADGVGYVNLSGTGKLTINNGMQIARDYGKNGGCEGYFTMSGGDLYTKSYFIMAFDNLQNSTHVTKGIFDMSGGTANISTYFCLAKNSSNYVSSDMIYGEVNIRNNSVINIGGPLGIANGENTADLVDPKNLGGTGIFNVFDNAAVTVAGASVIGNAVSSLNLYGGTFTAGAAGVTNAGTVKIDGGTLNGNVTNNLYNGVASNNGFPVIRGGSETGKIVGNINNYAGTILLNSGETLNMEPVLDADNSPVAGTGVITVGNATSAGNVEINGGTLNIGGTKVVENFRNSSSKKLQASLDIQNGTVTVNSGIINISKGGLSAGAPSGQSAVFTMNGGEVTSTWYPAFGAVAGTSGTMNLNGGTFNSLESFYVAGNGVGVLNIAGGELIIHGGMQLARNYDAVAGGCSGVINMSGGSMNVSEYFIAALNADSTANSKDVTSATLNVSGGTIQVGRYFTLAGNGNAKASNLIKGVANFSGNANMTVGGVFNLGNGEANAGLVTNNGYGTFNMYDNANVSASANVNIGSLSEFSLFGGKFNATGAANTFSNAGTVLVSGGELNVSGAMTNNANAKLDITAGTNGFGKLNVDGNLTNNGTISVGIGSGLAMIEGYDADKGVAVATVKGQKPATIVNGDMISSAVFSGNDLMVKLTNPATSAIFDAACGSFSLDVAAKSGWIEMSNFSSNDPYVFLLDVTPGTGTLDDFISQLNTDLKGSGNLDMLAQKVDDKVEISGITTAALKANAFTWNFGDVGYAGATLAGAQSNQVPEPTTWFMLLLGAAGLGFYRKRNRQ